MTEPRPYGSAQWKRVRLAVLDRDGWRCVDCGKPATMVDHEKPWRQGGDWFAPSNLVAVCRSDNVKRAYKTGGRQDRAEPRTPLTW